MIAPVLALVCALALPADGPSLPVQVSGNFGAVKASALWSFPAQEGAQTRDFAFAEVYQPPDKVTGGGTAVVGTGSCFFDKGKYGECRGLGIVHEINAGEFELSPTLGTARLDYDEGTAHQHVEWRAKDQAPAFVPLYGVGLGGVAIGAQLARDADADGTIDNGDLGRLSDRSASLSRGGGFGASSSSIDPPGAKVHRTVDRDGRVHLTVTWRH